MPAAQTTETPVDVIKVDFSWRYHINTILKYPPGTKTNTAYPANISGHIASKKVEVEVTDPPDAQIPV